MNLKEAEDIIIETENKSVTTEEDEFRMVEALMFIFKETRECKPILYLGGYYYGKKDFDLALKYYDMAAGLGSNEANLYLGYVWYYGRTGQRDYEKAFKCFEAVTKATVGDDKEHGQVSKDDQVEASLKIADMYKNGYYVKEDYKEYKKIIDKLFKDMKLFFEDHDVFQKYAEVGLRKAGILEQEGKKEKALEIYYVCRYDLAVRLTYNLFFGDVNQMSWVIDDIYRITEFDSIDFDLYDLFHLLKEEHQVQFLYENKTYIIESKKDKEGMSYRLEDKWYRTFNDLLLYGSVKNESLPYLYGYSRLENWEILK